MPLDRRIYSWRGTYLPANAMPSSSALARLRLGVKDIFDVAELPTGAGNPDWLASHPIPTETAPAVLQLMAAGAELVAKTQTDELTYSLNGLNIHYGAPLNPRSPTRLPGGSSSGSAVAVALGEIDIGLGSDTGGSVRVPASYNGLFGIRTSHGLISRTQMVPLAPSFDTVGWLTRDAALLLRVGEVLLPNSTFIHNRENTPSPLKIALLEPTLEQESAQPIWSPAHEHWLLQQSRIAITKRIHISSEWFTRASDCFRTLQGRELWRSHGAWINQRKPHFAQDIAARFEWASQLSAEQQRSAQAERLKLTRNIAQWFEGVDLVVMPTTPGAAPLLSASDEALDHYRSLLLGLTAPAGLAGLPQVHLPVLLLDQAPAGISLLGPKWMDLALLQLAAQLNYATIPFGAEASSL